MDFALSHEQKEIQQSIITFGQDQLSQNVKFRDKEQQFDRSIWIKAGELQLQGLCIPEKYGGRGYDPLTTVLALEALGEGCEDGGLCFAISAHLLACSVPIWLHGSEYQKQEYLPKLSNGLLIAGNAMTEPIAGSDVYNLKTTASISGQHYEINGFKSYISNGPVSDVLVTYASSDKSKGFFGGITSFLIDLKKHGVDISEPIDKMGVRTCMMGEAHFDHLLLDDTEIIGKTGAGGMIFSQSMDWERICLGAIHLGTMKRILKNTIQFVKERKQAGKAIGEHQAISHKLADLQVKLEAAQWMTYHAAWKLDKSKQIGMEAASTKLLVSETFKQFALDIFQIYAGKAFRENHEAERLVRDAMASTIYSGTSEIQKNIIAKRMGI